jgi:hypothetical protein
MSWDLFIGVVIGVFTTRAYLYVTGQTRRK